MPYFGFCHTADHAKALEQASVNSIFKAMQDPRDALFEADLLKLIKPDGADENTADNDGGGGPPPLDPGASGGDNSNKPPAQAMGGVNVAAVGLPLYLLLFLFLLLLLVLLFVFLLLPCLRRPAHFGNIFLTSGCFLSHKQLRQERTNIPPTGAATPQPSEPSYGSRRCTRRSDVSERADMHAHAWRRPASLRPMGRRHMPTDVSPDSETGGAARVSAESE